MTAGGLDEALARSDASGASSFLLDALGNSVALTDSTGIVQTHYTYDPFGKTTITGQLTTNPAAYTGRQSGLFSSPCVVRGLRGRMRADAQLHGCRPWGAT